METSDSNGNIEREKHGKMKMKWKPQEDQVLAEIVGWHGPGHWDSIAVHLPGRTGKQCRERWITFLSPDVKRDQWSKEEDEILISMQSQYGNQWALMTKFLPGRSSISIKNRFKSLMRHSKFVNASQSKPIIIPKQQENVVDVQLASPIAPIKQEIKFIPQPFSSQNQEKFIFDFPLPLERRVKLFV